MRGRQEAGLLGQSWAGEQKSDASGPEGHWEAGPWGYRGVQEPLIFFNCAMYASVLLY